MQLNATDNGTQGQFAATTRPVVAHAHTATVVDMETLTDKTGAAVAVELDDERGAYVIRLVAEDVVAGKTFFIDRDNDGTQERIFYHTEVDEAFGGRGLATVLVREAVNATRKKNLLIVPVCPLVRGYLTKNAADYEGAFRPNTAADFAWVKENRS